MKKNSRSFYFVLFLSLFFIQACNQEPPMIDKNIDENGKSSEYYSKKDYQIFDKYLLAVKLPFKLKDISNEMNNQFEFSFGEVINNGNSDQELYQILINDIPKSTLIENNNTMNKIEKLFVEKIKHLNPEKISFNGLNGYLVNYENKGQTGEGLYVFFKGKTYAFNLITNCDLEKKFQLFLQNIKFINNETIDSIAMSNKFVNDLLEISYPITWQNPSSDMNNVTFCKVSPEINPTEYRQNVNIIISSVTASLEDIWKDSYPSIKKYFKGYKLISRTSINIEQVAGYKNVFNGYIESTLIRFVSYEFLINNSYIIITFCTEDSKFEKQKSNITTIINTLHFKSQL